jgi:hypothetical protein
MQVNGQKFSNFSFKIKLVPPAYKCSLYRIYYYNAFIYTEAMRTHTPGGTKKGGGAKMNSSMGLNETLKLCRTHQRMNA